MNLHRFADFMAWLIKNDYNWIIALIVGAALVAFGYFFWS